MLSKFFRSHFRAATAKERYSKAAIFLLLTAAAIAQQPQTPQTTADDGSVKFSVTQQLVIETVVVNDKAGKPIEGLTKNDFTVLEDGKEQKISVFEYETLPMEQGPPQPSGPERGTPVDKLARTQIAPEPPGSSKYRDRRLLALYFDMTAMPPPDQYRALDAAQKFIRERLTKSD